MIRENIQRILAQLPAGVQVVAAGKSRNIPELQEAVRAGIKIIGENYIQEAADKFKVIGRKAQWHFIGHLQRNKVKEALEIFDLIETVDSLKIAQEIDKACRVKKKVMPVLIEINSAREKQKFGVFPEDAESLVENFHQFQNIRALGLMTMGPFTKDGEELRPYFRETRKIFEHIKSLNLPGTEMRYLSMGMSDSYRIAIEEGANLVRIGTSIFGKR